MQESHGLAPLSLSYIICIGINIYYLRAAALTQISQLKCFKVAQVILKLDIVLTGWMAYIQTTWRGWMGVRVAQLGSCKVYGHELGQERGSAVSTDAPCIRKLLDHHRLCVWRQPEVHADITG